MNSLELIILDKSTKNSLQDNRLQNSVEMDPAGYQKLIEILKAECLQRRTRNITLWKGLLTSRTNAGENKKSNKSKDRTELQLLQF